jgi:hypothetical protein
LDLQDVNYNLYRAIHWAASDFFVNTQQEPSIHSTLDATTLDAVVQALVDYTEEALTPTIHAILK